MYIYPWTEISNGFCIFIFTFESVCRVFFSSSLFEVLCTISCYIYKQTNCLKSNDNQQPLYYYYSLHLLPLSIYKNRYNILDPNITKGVEDDRKASGNLLDSVKLDENLYRLGHTKARFPFKKIQFCCTWNQKEKANCLN